MPMEIFFREGRNTIQIQDRYFHGGLRLSNMFYDIREVQLDDNMPANGDSIESGKKNIVSNHK